MFTLVNFRQSPVYYNSTQVQRTCEFTPLAIFR